VGLIYFRNKWVFYGVALVLFFVLIFLTKIVFTPTGNLQRNNVTPSPTAKTVNPCAQFPTDKGEISCEEAKGIALKKYPGQLLSAEKTIRRIPSGTPPKTQIKEGKVWIINIRPNDLSIFPPMPKGPNNETQTIDTIGIIIDRATKEIVLIEPVFKK